MQEVKQRKTETEQKSQNQEQSKIYTSTFPYEHPLARLREYLQTNLIGGPKVFQINHIINTFKGATLPFLLFLMIYYQNFSLSAYTILALHGSYGIIWIVKDCLFPDKSWQVKQTLFSTLLACALLTAYWSIGWQIISRRGITEPSLSRVVTACFAYIFGVTLMVSADVQKYITLKYKQGLINEGLFARCRNPNYQGEMLLYGSFAILCGTWESYGLLLFVWSTLFNMNMYLKDLSLRKKQGWDEYSKKSYLFLFKFFDSDINNYIFYSAFIAFLCIDYMIGGSITLLKFQQ